MAWLWSRSVALIQRDGRAGSVWALVRPPRHASPDPPIFMTNPKRHKKPKAKRPAPENKMLRPTPENKTRA